MNKLKKIFGSVYVRFLAIFIGVFFVSILIPALGVNVTRAPEIKRDTQFSMTETARKIKELTDNHEMSLEDAAEFFSDKGVNIKICGSLDEIGMPLSDEDKRRLDETGMLSKGFPDHNRQHGEFELFVLFRVQEKWVMITPDGQHDPVASFRQNQILFVVVPLLLGTLLIILASITVAKPVKEISKASQKVAKGDFSVRLKPEGSGEIRELADNFNSMVEELSANEYLHKEFVSNVSHEFGTPITSIRGYAKLMKRDSLTPKQRAEYADIIISESERLSRLSSDLLKLSELENKGEITERTEFALDEQIRSVIILLQHSWENKNISLDIDLDEIIYSGDEALLHQIWVNLISNAVRYTDNGGEIKIALKKRDTVSFTITDNGKGMTEEETKNVFRRFYKADKSRSSEGTGLGLAIARKIALLHGGDITVTSSENIGTT
ncbi:MAG: HAMP domain-containing histidine kinase, partial [Oscillospiraceae bacterium]|nr:HAMP domain-containing histidine kinase [Oscillospiraceae bacterium]